MALLSVLALVVSACGPDSPVDERGEPKDPVALARVLPTAAGLTETQPARPVGAEALAEALVGRPDSAVASRLASRGAAAAAVRVWEGADGARLVVATSVWPSHVTAVSVGAQAAERLLALPGASAWTPGDAPGARGARVRDGSTPTRALALAVGPNSLFVRSWGPVGEDVVIRSLRRLRLVAEGDAAERT